MSKCFHCGEALPAKSFQFKVLGEMREMCCMGCYAVTEAIVSAGLEHYYQERDVVSPTAPLPEALTILQGYDHPDTQQQFIHREQHLACAELSVEGVSCAACAWLIERRLIQEPAVSQASVNLSSHRLRLLWDDSKTPLSQLLSDLEKLGYKARPFRTDTHAGLLKKESRQLLMRLGVAALGSMQAMMYATGIYFGAFSGMEVQYRDYFRFISLIVTTPIFFYSGYIFYRSAWYAIKARSLNMDVPVSIALIISFFASIYATVTGSGETYFDSVSMFIFFLLTGRYLEAKARRQASETATDLIPILPRLAHHVLADGQHEQIPVTQLQVGDKVLVKAGETLPCDGKVLEGSSAISEALLTGEPLPISKTVGDRVVSGSQNHDSPMIIEVTKSAQSSTLATLHQLINRALSEKPLLAQRADKMAHWFVARVLVLAVVVYVGWYFVEPSHAFWAMLAVLVATCPCALSLATPVALTAATNTLAEHGFLVTRGHVLEAVAQATHIVFDKTGTLTEGKLELVSVDVFQGDAQQAKLLAAALEQYSEHPVAAAFKPLRLDDLPLVTDMHNTAGAGLTGTINGQVYRIGHAEFALGHSAETPAEGYLRIWLSNNQQAIASFDFRDKVRPEAQSVINMLKLKDLTTLILSGDQSHAPQKLAAQLGIDTVMGGLSPQEKSAYVQQLQADGAIVIMVGDGVNDAPVLGQSHVSVAMSSGADLAQTTADAILLGDRLSALVTARQIAIKTQLVIKQNLKWAFVYNLSVLPPAALGYIPPWLAAIGMSLSSLFVVLNALRLKRVN
jgi:Cu2+-exporting ATPase